MNLTLSNLYSHALNEKYGYKFLWEKYNEIYYGNGIKKFMKLSFCSFASDVFIFQN